MKKDKVVFNVEDYIEAIPRMRFGISDEELSNAMTLQAVKDHNVFCGFIDQVWEMDETSDNEIPFSTKDEFIAILNSAFISDVKRAIKEKLLLSSDSPLVHKIADILNNEKSVVSKETKEIALSLIGKAKDTLTEKETRISDSNARVQAMEIVNKIRESEIVPAITDDKVFFSALHALVKKSTGKKRLNSFVETLIASKPETVSDEQVRNIIAVGNHVSRQATKRAIEKNKRNFSLLSAIATDFQTHKYFCGCERNVKLGKKSGIRISEKSDGHIQYVKVFCYDCRTSVCYPISYNREKPVPLSKRVKKITGISLAECKRRIGQGSLILSILLEKANESYNSDLFEWKRGKSEWKRNLSDWMNKINGIPQTAQGAGISGNIGDRKPKNRIRTR